LKSSPFRRTSVFISFGLVGVLALSACGAKRAEEAVTEQAVVATHAAAEETPDTLHFTADISGDASVEMPPGELVYRDADHSANGEAEVQPYRVLQLTASDDTYGYVLNLMFEPDLETGTHPISIGVFAGTEAVAAEFVVFPAGESADSADAVRYNDNVEGSLTLDRAGEQVTGHFEFTAESTVTAEDGTESVVSIMAAGTFDDAKLAGQAGATDEPDATLEAATEEAGA
jgi:hypothetical protein